MWFYVQYGISILLFLNLGLRMIFNVFKSSEANEATNKIPNNLTIDKFLAIDLASASYSAFVFWFISIQTPETMMDPNMKNIINYMVAAVIALALGRFFILQLVVPSVSKMLLTLVSMLVDVKGFAILMLLYCLIMTQIFSTMY